MKQVKVVRLPQSLLQQETDLLLDELDRKCTQIMDEHDYSIALVLPESLKIGLKVLWWLDDLMVRFTTQETSLYIISNIEEQIEAIDLSHHDQPIPVFKDISELSRKLQASVEDDDTHREDAAASESILPIPGTIQDQIIKTAGEKVETTGEYRCLSCHENRMWLKGDTFASCSNDICVQKNKGWQLTFVLF